MIDLLVFDRNISLQGEISEYINLEIDRKRNERSTLILDVQATAENVALLKVDNIITTASNNAYGYIIQHVAYSRNGTEQLEVVAFSLNFILSYRTIFPQIYFYGNHEQAIRNAIERHLINPSSAQRRISNFVLGEFNNVGFNNSFSKTGGDLLEYSMSLANEVGATVDVLMNHQTRQFEVIVVPSVDRSINQNVNSPVMFSDDFDNVIKQDYFLSLIDYKSTPIVAGEGEGVERIVTNPTNFSGFDRRELYVDARDLQSTYKDENDNDVTLSTEEYTNTLISRGNERILENDVIESFETDIDDTQFVYGVDYFIGDRVSVANSSLGITLNVPVTSVKIVSNRSGVTIQPSLGSGIPSLYRLGGR